ncbi:MAG: Gfo/Idh/MocA family oxidoreductase [Planctomycetota bacterium]
MKTYKIALAGCGRISESHFSAIGKTEGRLRLTAVCDVLPERAEAAAKETGAAAYADYEEMLEKARPDAVAIATPSGLHPEMGIMAAERGIHVVSEKPIGISLAPVDRLIETCDRKGVRLFCVKQNRLNATMQILKRAVDKGRFGRIYLAQANVFWHRPQSYYDLAPWRGSRALDGGAFLNQASHYVDSLYWLLGEVESVTAFTATLARRIPTEDTGAAALRFKSGALGSMTVTMLAYPRNYEGSVSIFGETGTVKLGGVAVNRFEKWEFAEYDDDDRLVEESSYTPPNVYGFGHLAYYRQVLDALDGRDTGHTDGRSARKSLEIVLAIYRSAETGRTVTLPLEA